MTTRNDKNMDGVKKICVALPRMTSGEGGREQTGGGRGEKVESQKSIGRKDKGRILTNYKKGKHIMYSHIQDLTPPGFKNLRKFLNGCLWAPTV